MSCNVELLLMDCFVSLGFGGVFTHIDIISPDARDSAGFTLLYCEVNEFDRVWVQQQMPF